MAETQANTTNATAPSPHPLDFDWRYDGTTASALVDLLRDRGPTLAIGAPSVARLMQAGGCDITLVDRQPLQGVHNHVVAEATDFISDRKFLTALVDPPWYPTQLENWSAAAGAALEIGGCVFVSVWPNRTRPSASEELNASLERMSKWADITRNVMTLTYETPGFERTAIDISGLTPLSASPRAGELIRLDVRVDVPNVSVKRRDEEWVRFVIDDYQLAVRWANRSGPPTTTKLPVASGWRWPFVSTRAPGLNRIDIWSSDGEVAILGCPRTTIEVLRRAIQANNVCEFDSALSAMPDLRSWRIPRPPYRRKIEWLHRQ